MYVIRLDLFLCKLLSLPIPSAKRMTPVRVTRNNLGDTVRCSMA
jgi:hypothetical protein